MANDIFETFNQMIDTEQLKKDYAEVKSNTGDDFPEVPEGNYEVKIDKMEIKACKSDKHKGEPMASVRFRILEGKYHNCCLFMNKFLTSGMGIHSFCEFLRSLDSGVDIDFDGDFKHLNNTIMDVMEAVDGHLEYALKYSKNDKGFPEYEILEIFDV